MDRQGVRSGAVGTEPAAALQPAEVDRFSAEGFLVLPRLTTDEELERLREAFAAMLERREGESDRRLRLLVADSSRFGDAASANREVRVSSLMRPEAGHPELFATTAFHSARRVAEQLLGTAGAGLRHSFGQLIFKPAHEGGSVPWHQDEAYWDNPLSCEAVSVWLALDDVTLQSGCMQFLPGSHLGGVAPHRPVEPGAHGLVHDGADPARAVACPVPAGGATVHHCRTLHFTGPNTSDVQRRAWVNSFVDPIAAGAPVQRPWKARSGA